MTNARLTSSRTKVKKNVLNQTAAVHVERLVDQLRDSFDFRIQLLQVRNSMENFGRIVVLDIAMILVISTHEVSLCGPKHKDRRFARCSGRLRKELADITSCAAIFKSESLPCRFKFVCIHIRARRDPSIVPKLFQSDF